MSSYVFNQFKSELADGNVDLVTDLFSVALITSGAFANSTTPASVTAFSGYFQDNYEINSTVASAAGYNSIGYVTSAIGVANSGTQSIIDRSNVATETVKVWHITPSVQWDNTTIDADGYVIYRTSDSLPVLACQFTGYDTDGVTVIPMRKSSSNGTFKIDWAAGPKTSVLNLS